MNDASFIQIGLITRPHGLKGEVTLQIDEYIPIDIESLENIFIHYQDQFIPYFLESISVKGRKAYLKLEDVDSFEMATELAKSVVYIPKSERPELGPEAFYDDEIIGFQVIDSSAGMLGEVNEVIHSGLQRLIQINTPPDDILIPRDAFLTKVDKIGRCLFVDLPEGLLEL